jgi:hypothetical protein
MGNGDVDANGNGSGVRGGQEVNGDIQGATGGLVWNALGGFALNVMLCTD